MKNCLDQATEVLTTFQPSLADALRLAPVSSQAQARLIAAAFFSAEVRQNCLQEMIHSEGNHIADWFSKPSNELVRIEDIDDLKAYFRKESQGVKGAVDYLINKNNDIKLSTLVQDVIVAIQITTWINRLGEEPDLFSLLPVSLINEFELDINEIIQTKKVSEKLARSLAELMKEARQVYVRSYHQLNLLSKEYKLAVYTAIKFHEALLDEIIWNKFELFSGVQQVSSLRRRFMIFKAKRFIGKQK